MTGRVKKWNSYPQIAVIQTAVVSFVLTQPASHIYAQRYCYQEQNMMKTNSSTTSLFIQTFSGLCVFFSFSPFPYFLMMLLWLYQPHLSLWSLLPSPPAWPFQVFWVGHIVPPTPPPAIFYTKMHCFFFLPLSTSWWCKSILPTKLQPKDAGCCSFSWPHLKV